MIYKLRRQKGFMCSFKGAPRLELGLVALRERQRKWAWRNDTIISETDTVIIHETPQPPYIAMAGILVPNTMSYLTDQTNFPEQPCPAATIQREGID